MNGESITEKELRSRAEKRVNAIMAFRQHLLAYVVVNILLITTWLVVALVVGNGAWFPWFIFPLLGWGIGIAMHAWAVYGRSWVRRDQLVAKEMEKMRSAGKE
jgi:cytochrome b561